jgi:hypothetical protein
MKDVGKTSFAEKRLGLSPGEFSPKNVVIFICGLTGTITGTIVPLIDRGFVPDFKRIREALGVPADTLRRRPDVRSAERQLAAQFAQVNAARADLYPSFRLVGSIGLESISLFRLLAPGGLSPLFRYEKPASIITNASPRSALFIG